MFCFKQKTAYELKECDWSSDVCSSDLETFTDEAFMHTIDDVLDERRVFRRCRFACRQYAEMLERKRGNVSLGRHRSPERPWPDGRP